jgi:hypothetical protein
MSVVTNIRASAPPLPEVVGYVEAAATDRLLGWAWAPGTPELRATIELRLGDTVVATTLADLPRADLASNGIGDGRHAYEIAIPLELRDRAAELRVFARAADGEALQIGATPAADGLSDQVTKLLRGVDMLLNSQRMIHRHLQTALAKVAEPVVRDESAALVLARITEVQTATVEQLSAVEQFVVRLDEHLSRLAPVAGKAATALFPRAAIWALAVSGTALVVSAIGLVRSLGG